MANNFHISESEASLINPEYFVPLSTYLPYHPISTASPELLSASANRGSSIVTVVLSIVVVVPLTVKSPVIVTSSGNPIVTVAVSLPLPETVISLEVPAIVEI